MLLGLNMKLKKVRQKYVQACLVLLYRAGMSVIAQPGRAAPRNKFEDSTKVIWGSWGKKPDCSQRNKAKQEIQKKGGMINLEDEKGGSIESNLTR